LNQELKYYLAGKELLVIRPKPISIMTSVEFFNRKRDQEAAIEDLVHGGSVLIDDFYSTGLTLLSAIKQHVKIQEKDDSFLGQRDFRKLFRELSQRVLLHIHNHKLTIRKSPDIGWLEKLYPEAGEFLLPFPQVQGLNSAWQWYEKGIKIPGLRDKIHPYYGTYFPTRFDHVILFESWLKTYNGSKETAIDVGIGSGILSYMLLKYDCKKVIGTDHNPNAIIGQLEYQKKNKQTSNIDLHYGDLFAECHQEADVILFNPPWLPAIQHVEGLDTAIYYDEDLFPRFFEEAKKHLKPNGRLVLLFSNLAQITEVTTDHPIKDELEKGGRFEKELFRQQEVKQASKKTRRDQSWRATEKVELWVLKHS
jgi:methylase of polypeptide subunit release factors